MATFSSVVARFKMHRITLFTKKSVFESIKQSSAFEVTFQVVYDPRSLYPRGCACLHLQRSQHR